MIKKFFVSGLFIFVFLISTAVCNADTLLGKHPSVLITDENKEEILALQDDPVYSGSFNYMKSLAKRDLPAQTGYFSSSISRHIEARAFLYAIGLYDETKMKETIEYTISYIQNSKTAQTYSINMYKDYGMNGIKTGAYVYDWCHNLLTEEQKTQLSKAIVDIYYIKEDTNGNGTVEYVQPCRPNNVSGWGDIAGKAVGQPLVYNTTAAVALYDKYPTECNAMLEKIRGSMALAVKTYGQAGALTDGCIAYTREYYTYYAREIFKEAGFEDIYGNQTRVGYKILYSRLPWGAYISSGDDYTMSSYQVGDYAVSVEPTTAGLLGAFHNDGYLWHSYLKTEATSSSLDKILYFRSDVEPKLHDTLPLAFKADEPRSEIIARTSWQNGFDSPAAIAYMNMNNRRSGDHDHADIGNFQLFYKGPLAVKSGIYKGEEWGGSHWRNYATRTISANTMLVYDPDEIFQYGGNFAQSNDGGQKMIKNKENGYVISDYYEHMEDSNIRATEDGSYIGPNKNTPAFSYIKGDLTNAYSDKVSDYKRSMVFMDMFESDYPAVMVVFDRVVSSDKSFKKTWLLHGIEEPAVNENITTFVADEKGFNGKLVNKTMYPKEFNIETIGGEGREYEVEGVNYPAPENSGDYYYQGKWRIELSPKNESQEDIFLNSMYVTDADGNLPELKQECIEGDKVVGVSVKDRIVTFSKDGNAITDNFTITIPDNGYKEVMCLFTDVAEGNWKAGRTVISVDGTTNAVMMPLSPGTYTVTKTNNMTTAQKIYEETEKEKIGDFMVRLDGIFTYLPKETKLINGVAYIDAKHILPQLGAKLESESPLTFTKNNKTAVIEEGGKYTLSGKEQELSEKNVILDGEVYIPITEYTKFLDMNISYNASALVLTCTSHPQISAAQGGIIPQKVITNVDDSYRFYDGLDGTDMRLLDNFGYVTYDLGELYDITKCTIKATSDKYTVKGSADGVNFYNIEKEKIQNGTNIYSSNTECAARYITLIPSIDMNIDELAVFGEKFKERNYLFDNENELVASGEEMKINYFASDNAEIYINNSKIADAKTGFNSLSCIAPVNNGMYKVSMKYNGEEISSYYIYVYTSENKGVVFSENFNSGNSMSVTAHSQTVTNAVNPIDQTNAIKVSVDKSKGSNPYVLKNLTLLPHGIYTIDFDLYASQAHQVTLEIRDHVTVGSAPYPDSGPSFGFKAKEGAHRYKIVLDGVNSVFTIYCDGEFLKNMDFRIDDFRQFRFTFSNTAEGVIDYILDNVSLSYIECCQYEKYAFLTQDTETILSNTGSVIEKIKTSDKRRVLSITPSEDSGSAYVTFSESYGKDGTALAFDFKVSESEKDGMLFGVNVGTEEVGWQFKDTPKLYTSDMKMGNAKITANKWYRAIYIFDFTKHNYMLYITDIDKSETVLAAEGTVEDERFKNLGKVEFLTGNNNTVCIDSLKVLKPASFGFTILTPDEDAADDEHLAAVVPEADKVVFMLNGNIVGEYKGGGTYSVPFGEAGVKNGINYFEVFAFTGQECLKESVIFKNTGEPLVQNIFYTIDENEILMDEKSIMPANAESVVLTFGENIKNANAEIVDEFGNGISGSVYSTDEKIIIPVKNPPSQGTLIYVVLKSGTTVGDYVQKEDVYYPIFVASDDGLYISPVMYNMTEGGSVMYAKYVNLSSSSVNRKMFFAEYESEEKLRDVNIENVEFKTGENQLIVTHDYNKNVMFRKGFLFGKYLTPEN